MALRCGSRQTTAVVTLLSGLVTLVLAWTLYAHADNTVTGWVANVSRVAPPLSACNASATVAQALLDGTTRSTLLALHFVQFLVHVLLVLVAFPSSLPSVVLRASRPGVAIAWVLSVCCTVFSVAATLLILYGLDVVRDAAACDTEHAPPDSVIGDRPAVGTLIAFTLGNLFVVLFAARWIWQTPEAGKGYARPPAGGNPFTTAVANGTAAVKATEFSVMDSADDDDDEEDNVPLH
jgi:hypothetical protein